MSGPNETPTEVRGGGNGGVDTPDRTTIEAWFARLPHDEDTPKAEEEQALKAYLTGVQSSPDVAAQAFTSIVASADDPLMELPRIWNFLDDAAENVSIVQDRLVELLAAIQRLPDLMREGRPVTTTSYGDQTIWRDLPYFADSIRDRYDCMYTTASFLPVETFLG